MKSRNNEAAHYEIQFMTILVLFLRIQIFPSEE
jgi:hypothetical protein